MHYIRLLRPASIDKADPARPVLAILFTITTDLGDTFLYPDEPLELAVGWESRAADDKPSPDGKTRLQAVDRRPITWKPGMRALNAKIMLGKKMLEGGHVLVTIEALEKQPKKTVVVLTKTLDLLPWRVRQSGLENNGLVASVSFEITRGVPAEVSLRRVRCPRKKSPGVVLEIGEDIGESIARHIWDAGLVTTAYIDNARGRDESCHSPDPIPMTSSSPDTQQNILEIGCGVGILGIGIANSTKPSSYKKVNVLLTDLPEAEERARSNIERWEKMHGHGHGQDQGPSAPTTTTTATLDYESLDWDQGSQGIFGPKVRSRSWDCIVLSDCTYNVDAFASLVGTLSALHQHALDMDMDKNKTSRVILSTKRRHDSEEALFDMFASSGWTHRLIRKIDLPRLGSGEEDEMVELYSLEKKGGDDNGNTSAAAATTGEREDSLQTQKQKQKRTKRKATAAEEGELKNNGDDDDRQPSKRSAAATKR